MRGKVEQFNDLTYVYLYISNVRSSISSSFGFSFVWPVSIRFYLRLFPQRAVHRSQTSGKIDSFKTWDWFCAHPSGPIHGS